MTKGTLFIISGHSGSGKTSVMRNIMENELGSFTTRKKRDGEVDGYDYNFISEEVYFKMKEKGELAEYTTYDGNHYGITRNEVESKLKLGDAYAVVDVEGMKQLTEYYKGSIVKIYIYTDHDVAYRNMKRRGDSVELVLKRLKTYNTELKDSKKYDYVIKNLEGRFEDTVNIFKTIVNSYSV